MSLSQKEIAVRFLELAAAGEVDEAYGNYTAPNFKHHNPYYAGDKTSLKEGMRESAIETPNKVLEVQHVIEDGALVAVHSKLEMQMNNKLTILAVFHICRFENEKIAEFWDIGQIQPDPLVNENGMF
ncbi:ester cyclase [Acinetobacter baumannii]|nr:nuclear transport factor 2 family protein [Acinetobacter baumannii]EJB8492667.1 nuclear transport factor 2 family protein [Acinetobacter baumannii]EJB8500661.1 nuclear transport factor 2 family protein [Acinetobacter baumannii]MCT9489634.1 ester cyclase [Acinetobacter baumannii]HEE5572528.1 nuclear transport factor 2 family protein [Acinetobacter baumannii]